jgi:hypothetical protein
MRSPETPRGNLDRVAAIHRPFLLRSTASERESEFASTRGATSATVLRVPLRVLLRRFGVAAAA